MLLLLRLLMEQSSLEIFVLERSENTSSDHQHLQSHMEHEESPADDAAMIKSDGFAWHFALCSKTAQAIFRHINYDMGYEVPLLSSSFSSKVSERWGSVAEILTPTAKNSRRGAL